MTAPPRQPPRPRAFRLDDPKVVLAEAEPAARQQSRPSPRPERSGSPTPEPESVIVEAQPDPYERETAAKLGAGRAEAAVEVAQQSGMAARRGWRWSRVLVSAAGALLTLALGLWVEALIEALFARVPLLGWVGTGLVAAVALALAALLVREIAGVVRQSRIARLHKALASARAADDRDAARRLVHELAQLYLARPETARVRADLAGLTREIIDGRDLIDIAERSLIHPLDERVRREIAAATKRVSIVTAVSPRAILDVLFVAAQAIHLLRKTAEIYGGRPGLFGFFKLLRSVITHLAVTAGMAAGDSILQQFLGHGIASRISARLGEGVLNGLLTARIGLSAMAVCRPMPFAAERPPGVKDVAPFLFTTKKD